MVMLGKAAFIINEEDINHLYDCLYTIFTIVFTTSTTTAAWFKNNYITAKGKKQKQVLKKRTCLNSFFRITCVTLLLQGGLLLIQLYTCWFCFNFLLLIINFSPIPNINAKHTELIKGNVIKPRYSTSIFAQLLVPISHTTLLLCVSWII